MLTNNELDLINIILTVFLVCILCFISSPLQAQEGRGFFTEVDEHNNLRMGNEYIVIVVNQNNNGMGRFAIETTGGAPFKESDKSKPLVYGRPNPWTSYTTIKIDGEEFVFGGETERRAGKNTNYGQVINEPEIRDNEVYTATKINDIKIEQILKIVKSSTTGLYDSAQIKYRITNNGKDNKEIGLRAMLDTMLGENDGAPFRVGQEAITTDKLYLEEDLPTFWQAFDSISSPRVTSQGTFKGPGVTPPDRVYFSDWGSLADGSWDFDFNPGEEFIRKGDYEIDSAIALLWQPEVLKPGETRTYVTNYGLGGITIVPGLLSLGVTSPAEVTMDKTDKSFPVIAYLENTAEIEAEGVEIAVNLPQDFTTENPVKNLGDLEPGDIKQVIWEVKPKTSEIPEKIDYSVKVEAENTDANQVVRSVKFIAPPKLETKVEVMDDLKVKLGRVQPNPFVIKSVVQNSGGSILYDVASELVLPPGITLAPGEASKKYLSYIRPGEDVEVKWKVKSLNVAGGFKFAVNTEGMRGYRQTNKKDISLPEVGPFLYLSTDKNEIEPGDYVTVELRGEQLSDLKHLDLRLAFSKEFLKPIYVYPGNVFVSGDEIVNWSYNQWDQEEQVKIKQNLPSGTKRGVIATIQFKVLKGQSLPIEWHQLFTTDREGNEIDVKTKQGVIKVE